MSESPQRPWYAEVSRYQWTVLAIASLGWVFDVFEGQLYSILKTPAVQAVLPPGTPAAEVNRIAGLTLTCFLLGGAFGGAVFGVLGDRWGRRRVMTLTILFYSVFTALTAFAQSWEQLAVLRFLVAMGVGGEWAVAAALVAEVFPERSRTAASGLFHASSGLGTFLAALTGMAIGLTGTNWRVAFLLGLVPALLTLWIRTGLKDPERWAQVKEQQETAQTPAPGDFRELWSRRELFRRAVGAAGLATVGLAGLWTTVFWAPELAREVLAREGVTDPKTLTGLGSQAQLIGNFGNTAGLLCFAPITARLGRRRAFLLYHVATVALIPVTFLLARTYAQVVAALVLLGFAAVGMHAGYAIYFPELFPTRLRSTGAGFCFNIGRIVAAPAPWLMGLLAAKLGGVGPAAMAAGMIYLLGILCLCFLPETSNKPLPE